MIINFDGKSFETEKLSDPQVRQQVQAYVSQMAFNNQFQISLQKSNDKLQEELRPLLTDEALVEEEEAEASDDSESSEN
jgi:hypothetical protein|tara:strand:- start:360 stop:596 length:237 start_codon:yes stop_codon:yes gene_type:complete